jgi:hypothetical protein
MVSFEDQIARFIEETNVKIDETLQTIVLKIGRNLVTLSPVDTGRFKGNWQLSIGTGSNSSLTREDKEGSATLSEIATKVNAFSAGQIAYLQNHVLYGYDLEYGSSKQAPDGVVRITEAIFTRIVNEAIALNR